MIIRQLIHPLVDFRSYFALRASDDTERDDLSAQRVSRPLESK